MGTKGREIKVGIFAILMVSALYVGFNYLRGLDVFSPEQSYFVKFNNIGGLNKGDRVILSGMEIGSVLDRRFSSEAYDEIIVELLIDRTIKLKQGTVAKLTSGDLLGGTEIQIILNRGGTQELQAGDTLIGEIDKSITELLTEEGISAANRLTALVDKIEQVLEPFAESGDTIRTALYNFQTATQNLADFTDSLDGRMDQLQLKIEYVTDSLVAAMGGVKPLMEEYTKLGEKFNAIDIESRLVRVDSVLLGTQTLLANLNSEEGLIGELMTNDSLYHSLNRTMVDLDSLFMDFRQNPKRYVHFSLFGRKNRPPADKRRKKKK